jgi:DNA polymerase III alpha subunit
MLNDASRGKFDVVMAWAIDRVGRSLSDLGDHSHLEACRPVSRPTEHRHDHADRQAWFLDRPARSPSSTNDVLFHVPERRRVLQDVLTCIREHCTAVGFWRNRFADRCLKPPQEMARLFARHQEAVPRSEEIAARCTFTLDELQYQYLKEACIPGLTPAASARKADVGRCGPSLSGWCAAQGRKLLHYELQLIEDLHYAPYFLTVNSIVRFAAARTPLPGPRQCRKFSGVLCHISDSISVEQHTPVVGKHFAVGLKNLLESYLELGIAGYFKMKD